MYYSQLRAFHAVAVHGGFSKAADRLHLTQPAISDQVRKLEKRFDVLLFDRHKRSVRLTEFGRHLPTLRHAKPRPPAGRKHRKRLLGQGVEQSTGHHPIQSSWEESAMVTITRREPGDSPE